MDQFEPEINEMLRAIMKACFAFCFFVVGVFMGITYTAWRFL